MLWGRSASICSMPNCRKYLVSDESETDDPTLIGEECHIVARKNDGPRGESELTTDQRDEYENLILMCASCHKIIDDQVSLYSIDNLKRIKSEHISWVNSKLSQSERLNQKNEEYYADIIQGIVDFFDFDNYEAWTSYLLSSHQPGIHQQQYDSLIEFQKWIMKRIWPGSHLDLESTIKNIAFVVSDLIKVFDEHADKEGKYFSTKRFYKIDEWNNEKYHRLLDQYDYHVCLIEDLVFELTRSLNYFCDKVRDYVFNGFRRSEGALVVTSGPDSHASFKTYRTEYRNEERINFPYPGLEKFKEVRRTRDWYTSEEWNPPN